MYLPKSFEETRVAVLHDLIRNHPLGTLVTLTNEGLEANHIPFEIDSALQPFGTLRGHVARANPVWNSFLRDTEALVIFQGPQTYISPSWYVTKQETGMVVPTWNYAIVHAHGPLKIIEDREWLRSFVDRLTRTHETGQAEPWSVSDAPAAYIDKQLDAIVGIELTIRRLIGKWKASQNRPARDRESVIERLNARGGEAATSMARLMQQ
jgi:transcriptional regulator